MNWQNIVQLLLPSELKHRIAELSSRNSLASLARTHTAYQREAEQALYRTLSIRTRDDGSLKCLETLTTNSEKAGFVYFLTMECVRKENDENRRAMTYLLKALINMHSLSDLRLRMCRYEPEVGANLDKILWSVYELEVLIFSKLITGNIVTLHFGYKLCTANLFSTFLESSGVKPNCRYLEYTAIVTKKASWTLSNSFRMPN